MIRVTFLLALIIILAAVGWWTIDDNGDDLIEAGSHHSADVYAAAIREIHSYNRSSGAPGWSVVHVMTTADDLVYNDAPVVPSQKLPVDLQEAITAELTNEPYKLVWIDSFEEAPLDQTNRKKTKDEGIIISLGNIHHQEDDSVLLSYFMVCGDLCGFGTTLVLNEYYNNWHVSGSIGPKIAS